METPYDEICTLPSGLRVVHRHSDVPVAYCGLMVGCGSRDEAADEHGLAHFVEHALFKGTRRRDAWHVNNRMEAVGGELNAYTAKEETVYYAVFPDTYFGRACELLCDLVCHPAPPERELEHEREVVVDEIMSYRDVPAELIYDELEDRAYAGSPMGHSILGDEPAVRRFGAADCLRFVGRHYRPDRMVFFHVGRTPFGRVVRGLERWFDLPAPEAPWAGRAAAPWQGGTVDALPAPEARQHHQAHVLWGCPGLAVGHPDRAALALLNGILGGGGMNARLPRELREKRGLAYTVETGVQTFTDCGYLSIYYGADHADVARCQRLVGQQLDHLRSVPLTERQLEAARRQLKGQLGVATAQVETQAIALARAVLKRGRADTLAESCARIDAVTPADLLRVAQAALDPSALTCLIMA